MKLYEYPKPILDAYSAHEAFRRLGYPADDIFFSIAKDGRDRARRFGIFVILKQEKLEFSIAIGYRKKSLERMKKWFRLWQTFVGQLNTTPMDAAGRLSGPPCTLLIEYYIRWLERNGGGMSLVASLLAKGFRLPRLDDDLESCARRLLN